MPALIVAGAALAVSAYGTYEQKKSADAAAQVDTATASYNAKYDTELVQQLDADTTANIDTARKDDAVYLSKQAASYADAGVLATTGSALHAQITNAGRMEQKIQQQYVDSQQQQETYESQAKVGILSGQAQSLSDRRSGTLALINGGVQLSRMAFEDYRSGVFSSGSGTTGSVNSPEFNAVDGGGSDPGFDD